MLDVAQLVHDIARPDGKAGRLAALLGSIDLACDLLRGAKDLDRLDYASLAIGQMTKIVKAKQAYDEAAG